MKKHLIYILLLLCFTQQVFSQEDGVVGLSLPVRNSLKFNRYVLNPTFSFVREQNKYINFTNKRQWVQFDNAPQTYLVSYNGRLKENIGVGIGLFQQDYGVFNTFGGIVNFAYNAVLNRDSNLTFGLNLGYYQSGLNLGKVIVNRPDTSLDNIPSNSLVTINPGINYGTVFFDFGVSINNAVSYNLNTSEILENNPEQSVQGHIMYTGYMSSSGFLDDSKFSALIRSEFKKEITIVSGVMMLTIPKGIWGQVGYNSLYGVSVGLGLNMSKQIALEYNYEQSIGELSAFGNSHDITLAYRFKNKERYLYSGDDKEIGLLSRKNRRRAPVKRDAPAVTQKDRETIAKARETVRLQNIEKARIKLENRAKLVAEAKAKRDAKIKEFENKKVKAEELARLKREEEAKAKAEELARLKRDEEAKAKAEELARLKRDEEAKAKAEELARLKRDEEAKAKAEELARLKREEEAKAKAEELARLKRDEEAKAKAEELARLKRDEEAKAKAEELARLKRDEEAKAKAEELARLKRDEDAKAKAEELARLKREEEAKAKAEELARLKRDEEAKLARLKRDEEAKAKAEELARLKREEEAKAKAEELARLKRDEEAKAKAEELARLKRDEEAKAKAEELARLKRDEEAKAKAEELARLKRDEEAKAKAEELARLKRDEEAKAKAEELARLKRDEEAKAKAEELARLKRDEEAKAKAEELARLKRDEEAKAKAQELARLKRDEEAKAKAAELARLKRDEEAKAEELARLKRDEEAKAKAAELARLKRDEEAKAKAEELARLKRDEEAKAKAEELARLKRDEEAKAKAEELARLKRDEEAKQEEPIISSATDEIAKSLKTVQKSAEQSELVQKELIEKLTESVDSKQQTLNDLKKENDLSEKGIVFAPKPFKSISAENSSLEAVKQKLENVIDSQGKKISELENLYNQRLKKFKNKNDSDNLIFSNAIAKAKFEQSKTIKSRDELISKLESIKLATDIERKRRIKRAAYDNVQDRYLKDKATLEQIKKFTALSTEPLTENDFNFGEKLGNNIKIIKNIKNVDSGYYLVVAVHNNEEKRDEFLRKAVAAGETNINFFYDVISSKYFIYYKTYSYIEQAQEAMLTKGSKPYNSNMSMVKIEN